MVCSIPNRVMIAELFAKVYKEKPAESLVIETTLSNRFHVFHLSTENVNFKLKRTDFFWLTLDLFLEHD